MLQPLAAGPLGLALVSEHASPLAAIGGVDAGGQNVHVAELAAGLCRLGHRVTVYTRRDDPALPRVLTTEAGYDVVHLTAGPARVLPKDAIWPHLDTFADDLTACLRRRPADLIHGHFWMSGWAAAEARRRLGTPVVVTFHALGVVKRRHQGAADTSPAERIAVEARLARTADHVVATCSDEVAELVAQGADPDRLTVVPCGVDTSHFTPVPDDRDRSFARPPGGPARLVAVGRLVRRKGFGNAIEAIAHVPHAELLIAGGPEQDRMESDPEARRLLALARRLGVADRVRLLGPVPREQLPALLRSADLVVCSPWYEPFGIVPLEAMACGVPVVAAAVGGLLDTVRDGVTGTHVPPRDPAALAAAISALLADPERRRRYGLAALARVRRDYTWSSVAARTAGVYAAEVGRARPRVAVRARVAGGRGRT